MKRKVYFHGPFKEAHDGPVEVVASTLREAIELVTLQLDFFKPDLNGRKTIKVLGVEHVEDLEKRGEEEIHIMPALVGGKKGGFFQVIVGATLVAASLLLPPGPWTPYLMSAGISMIIGGVIQMLMPTPKTDTPDADPEASKYIGARGNTTRIGTRIPLLLGEDKVYGHFLSFDVDAKDVAV